MLRNAQRDKPILWSQIRCYVTQFSVTDQSSPHAQDSETFMVVAGIFLKANLARFVALTGSRKSHLPVGNRFNKLELIKNPTQDDVEVFAQLSL